MIELSNIDLDIDLSLADPNWNCVFKQSAGRISALEKGKIHPLKRIDRKFLTADPGDSLDKEVETRK